MNYKGVDTKMNTNLKQIIFPERKFWKNVFGFAIPIALQNLSVALFGIIDTSVISNMGEEAVSAVSLANQVFYVASLITFGITSGASVLLSRYYGAKEPGEFRKAFTIMTLLSLIVNAFVTAASFGLPNQLLALYTDEKVLIEAGAIFLIITAPMNLFYAVSNSMSAFFRAVQKPSVPMAVSFITVVVKTGLNFAFIYGMGPIPAMGIAGAAIATLAAKIAELLAYLYFYIRFKEKEYRFRACDLQAFAKPDVFVFLKDTAPVIVNESMWGLGISLFNAVFGRMGVTAVTTFSVARQLENLGNTFFYGIGIGACVTISSLIGQQKFEEAKLTAKRYALVGFEVGVFIMFLMLGINNIYVDTFFTELTPETCSTAKVLNAVIAVYMPFRSLASALIMGVLRAGGDSKHAMYYDVIPVYAWALAVGFLLGVVWDLPSVIVLAIMQFKRVIKCAFALRRLWSDKWLSD